MSGHGKQGRVTFVIDGNGQMAFTVEGVLNNAEMIFCLEAYKNAILTGFNSREGRAGRMDPRVRLPP